METIIITEAQELDALGRSKDPRLVIGTGHYFETIDALLLSTDILKEGLLSTDVDNSVTWQIYLDGATWKARIYDGVFFVDIISMAAAPGQIHTGTYFYGTISEDGYDCSTGDVILVVNCSTPHMNGPWVVNTTGHWSRHPLFDEDTDNIKNITFVAKRGTVYSGSKWVFTTNGALTIKSTMAEFATGTWLDFEQLTPTKNYESQTLTSSGAVNRFKRHTLVDATSGDLEINIGVQIFPNVEYLISKIDNTVNQVRIARTVGDVIAEYILLEQGDWVRFIHYGEALTGTYQFISNRINKTLTQATVSATGKLGTNIPKGYRLYSITSTISGNSGDVTMDYGTGSTLSDLDASVTLVADTPYTKVLNLSNANEVWLTSADWLGGSVDITMLIVEDKKVSSVTGDGTNQTIIDNQGHQTMEGLAKPWEDLRIEPTVRTGTPAGGIPTFEKYFDDLAGTSKGVFLYSFTDESNAANEKEIFFTIQMPHAWDGGPISPHVHFVPAATVNATDIVWGLEYTWKDIGEVYGDTTIVYSSTTLVPDDANITAGKHYIAEFADITPGTSADGVSSIMIGRLFRYSSNGSDTYTNKVGLLYVDIHYQLSSLGSNDEYLK